jgi:hypothetical protein
LLCELKFNPSGFNPAVGKDAQVYHLIEQINQSMTYLTTALAVRWLEQKYPNVVWLGSLGTQSGTDVYASDGTVLCEVFSVVNQTNNGKLRKDIRKVLSEKGKNVDAKCYVFCYLKDGAEVKLNPEVNGVEVVYFGTEQLQKIWENPESFSFNS